ELSDLSPAQLALPMLLTGVVCVTALEGVLGTRHRVALHVGLRPGPLLAALTLGVVNAGIGNVVYYTLIRSWGVTRTALVGYLVPVVGVGLGVALLHDPLEANM